MSLTALLEDGPCAGSYSVIRAPRVLMATVGTGGETYVLDEDDDVVSYGEQAFIYQRQDGGFHICGRGVCEHGAIYTLAGRPVIPDGATPRVPTATDGRFLVEVEPCAPDELERWAARNRERLLRAIAPPGTRRPDPPPTTHQEALF